MLTETTYVYVDMIHSLKPVLQKSLRIESDRSFWQTFWNEESITVFAIYRLYKLIIIIPRYAIMLSVHSHVDPALIPILLTPNGF